MVPGWNETESAGAGAGAWRNARGVMARRRQQQHSAVQQPSPRDAGRASTPPTPAPTAAPWPAFTRVSPFDIIYRYISRESCSRFDLPPLIYYNLKQRR